MCNNTAECKIFFRLDLVWVYGMLTNVDYVIPNPFIYTYKQFSFRQFSWAYVHSFNVINTVLVQRIQFSIQRTSQFQTIQFTISTPFKCQNSFIQAIYDWLSSRFNFIWLINRALSGATPSGQSGPESDGNERVLYIPQSSGITWTSPSVCLLSYLGHLLCRSLTLCRESVGVFYNPIFL